MPNRLGKFLSELKVSQKIGLGYALALGFAVSGTIAGFGVGDYYKRTAETEERHFRRKVELLYSLQSYVLQTRTHQQQLIPLLQFPDRFQEEYQHMMSHRAEIAFLLGDLKRFIKEDAPYLEGHTRQNSIPEFIERYERIPQRYSHEIEHLAKEIQTSNLQSPAAIESARAKLLEFSNSEMALEFDSISDNLSGLIEQARQYLDAAIISRQQSEILARNIVLWSSILSILIAIAVAIVTSRMITKPIQTLTTLATRSTEESNFDLRAEVDRNDEIGLLAKAFNHMIVSVKKLLEEQEIDKAKLKSYSQDLELKVEVIRENNVQLKKVLDELQQTQTQMIQGEKMSALGQMVAGIAHEINNPVNFIHGNLQHVQEYSQNLLSFIQLYEQFYSDPIPEIQEEAEEIDLEFVKDDLPKMLNSMRVGTDRIRKIILSLRNFSRMDEADLKAVDIHEGIESTLLILQHRLKSRSEHPEIQVIRDYADLPEVKCYPGQLNQVFMNIFSNAIDALDEVNAKRSYQEIQDNPSQIKIQTTIVDKKWIAIAIADNGPGIPESVQKRIFDPFFTTKEIGKGTGMGLSISHQIVTGKHGGQLNCDSAPGKGTRFTIQIPA